MTRVSGIVVSHGHARELETLLPALAPQVDELVVVANRPGSVPRALPPGVRVLENVRPRRLAENVNLGTAATSGDWVVYANPDVVPGTRRRRSARVVRRDPGTMRPRGAADRLAGRPLAADAASVPDGARHDRPPDAASRASGRRSRASATTTCSTRT